MHDVLVQSSSPYTSLCDIIAYLDPCCLQALRCDPSQVTSRVLVPTRTSTRQQLLPDDRWAVAQPCARYVRRFCCDTTVASMITAANACPANPSSPPRRPAMSSQLRLHTIFAGPVYLFGCIFLLAILITCYCQCKNAPDDTGLQRAYALARQRAADRNMRAIRWSEYVSDQDDDFLRRVNPSRSLTGTMPSSPSVPSLASTVTAAATGAAASTLSGSSRSHPAAPPGMTVNPLRQQPQQRERRDYVISYTSVEGYGGGHTSAVVNHSAAAMLNNARRHNHGRSSGSGSSSGIR